MFISIGFCDFSDVYVILLTLFLNTDNLWITPAFQTKKYSHEAFFHLLKYLFESSKFHIIFPTNNIFLFFIMKRLLRNMLLRVFNLSILEFSIFRWKVRLE